MVEEGAQVVVPVTPEPAAEAPTMFDAEGNFSENWTHLLTDTALHDNPTLKASKTIESLASQTVSAQKMVGADKIAVPNEASTELEWETFHKAGGRPETAADYNFAKPEELSDENYSQEYVNGLQDLLFAHGASKKLADALVKYDTEFKVNHLATTAQDEKLAMTGLQDGLVADWGNAYEQKKHDGNRAIEEASSVMENGAKVINQEFKNRLVEKAGNDPDMIRAFANLGAKFRETGSLKIDSVPTPADIQETINDELAKPAYSPDYAKHGFTRAQHDAQVQKVKALFEERDKYAKTG